MDTTVFVPRPPSDPAGPGTAAVAGGLSGGLSGGPSAQSSDAPGAVARTDRPREVAVRARALTKVYGSGGSAVRALDAVDVDFGAGEFTAIMGPSGSGKSTLMHLLAGLDSASAGAAYLGSTETTSLGDSALTRLRRDRVGFVFQSFNLLPMFTAEQNILLPLEIAGTRVDTAVRAWFDTLVGTLGLSERLSHRPAELSGGQQQRVAIARALIARPEVVFADEPTGNLDSRAGAEVLGFLRRSVRELGRTVIMVTHDPTAASYADRVVLLADGRIAGDIVDPTPESVLTGLDALRSVEAPLDGPAGTR